MGRKWGRNRTSESIFRGQTDHQVLPQTGEGAQTAEALRMGTSNLQTMATRAESRQMQHHGM